eukprot:6486915-Amphidinium_carterae.1
MRLLTLLRLLCALYWIRLVGPPLFKHKMLKLFGSSGTLEVGPQARGHLRLCQKTLKPPSGDQEAQQAAMRQHVEAGLLRTARAGQGVLPHAWPSWLEGCPPTAVAQRELLEGRSSARKSASAKATRTAWKDFVKEAWENAPRKIFKWLRGKTLVWNLAVSLDGRWAAGPAQVAELEVQAWSALWQGRRVVQDVPRRTRWPPRPLVCDSPSPDLVHALLKKAGKRALGADRWAYPELLALVCPGGSLEALSRLCEFYQVVETQGYWPESLRDILFLQLPKAGARNAGERRPIALLPVVYR